MVSSFPSVINYTPPQKAVPRFAGGCCGGGEKPKVAPSGLQTGDLASEAMDIQKTVQTTPTSPASPEVCPEANTPATAPPHWFKKVSLWLEEFFRILKQDIQALFIGPPRPQKNNPD